MNKNKKKEPITDRDYVRDSVTEMQQLRHADPRMLVNALADMGMFSQDDPYGDNDEI